MKTVCSPAPGRLCKGRGEGPEDAGVEDRVLR